jgi:DNA-binding IclR family transcriptional regulator
MHSHPTSGCTRTLELLELLAFGELTAPQAAVALGIHPRTARRQLRQLASTGWAADRPGVVRTYGPGMRPLAASWHLLVNHPLTRLAAPVLARLARDGHLAELAVPSYDAVLALSRTTVDAWQARALPPHASAAGKLLLAGSDAWRRSRLSGPLERFTPATLTDPLALEVELEGARARGYALERGEHREGQYALAVPLTSPDGRRRAAAISIGGRDPAAFEGTRLHTVLRRALGAMN